MNEILTLISTAICVSLDSLAAGISLSINKNANRTLPAAVALVTLLLCLLTSLIGAALKNYFYDRVNVFGALILFCLALVNIFKNDDKTLGLNNVTIGESLAIGLAVGTDAAVANLSLAMDGFGLIAPFLFAVTHYLTVFIGQTLAKKIVIKRSNLFSAVILTALAVTKLI